ncbi:hypothetical protein pipiens_001421 [Culex pipiens pipiens]|uniref:Uncharacterized protein n=1 Tax=Culex pipiens pipiens TaxID=38569 RepID=A0ABD1CVF9_CULPP
MKFVLVLAALVAVACAVPSESSGTLDPEKLQQALIEAGMNPEEAHGFMDFIRSAGRVIRDKVLPAATKILPIATQIAGAFGNQNLSSDQYPTQLIKMKFVLVLAALVAVAFAAPSESSGSLDPEKLQQALIDAGMNPEEAHGFMDFIRSAGRVIRDKVLPAATKILPIATQIAGAFGK